MKTERMHIQALAEWLTIKPFQNQDYDVWIEGIQNRFPSQHIYDDAKMDLSGWTQEKFNEDIVATFQQVAGKDKVYVFGIFRTSDQKHIGKVEFSTVMREEFQWGLVGYAIHNQYWRKGYGKEAVKEALHIAFKDLDFHRMEAHINMDNIPSIQLVESIGMVFECTRKGFIFEFDEWTDNLVYYMNAL